MIVSSVGETSIVAQERSNSGSGVDKVRMGRKKIQISRIGDERNRQVTFTKRKFGLMKKAYELSVLCDCEIALIIFNSANKLFQYASTDMDKVLLKYTEYNEPHESRTNKDIIESLNKKDHKGCESPEPDTDPYSHPLTPEEKYSRMNEEYQRVMHQNSMRHGMSPYPNPGMPPGVTSGMPIHNPTYMSPSPIPQGHGMSPNPNGNPNLLHPPVVHPSGSPRPNSTGGMVDMSVSSPANGYHHHNSPCPSPGAMGNKGMSRQSPPSRGPHSVRPMIHSNRNDMMSPDPQARPTNASMHTPAVSLTTPSIQGSNYPSPLPTTYHSNDYPLNNSDMSVPMSNYSHLHWSGQGSLCSGIPPGGLQVPPGSNNPGGGHLSPLAINTINHNMPMHIKSEPISPPRDSTTPSNLHSLRPPSSGQGHLSPVHMNHTHSNNSSPNTNSQPLEYDGPLLKRTRVDHGWTT
ncbi:myocyte-specific enhancer factor 2C-like isoform X1 [Pecten maximus]|uniref:myocyte-specific enhancer factor 2C-like isoform X1 n=2 Tax=Pecten maximus TaxID=6579 RepID=UPI001458ABEC|nr:myocyte-specific enhancer factor 2C-like isoform X1 [Pecten maximus]